MSCRLQAVVIQFCFSLVRFDLSCSMVSWRNGKIYVLAEHIGKKQILNRSSLLERKFRGFAAFLPVTVYSSFQTQR